MNSRLQFTGLEFYNPLLFQKEQKNWAGIMINYFIKNNYVTGILHRYLMHFH